MPALPNPARRPFFALMLCATALAAGALSGCSALAPSASGALPAPPALQLPPAQLAQDFQAVQRMQVQTRGQARSFDVMLEASRAQLQLAILQLGQTIAVIGWDGHTLTRQLAPGWPEVIPAAQLVSELQYVWWPLEAINAALPSPAWQLQQSPAHRQLKHGEETVLDIRSSRTSEEDGTITLVNHAQGYTVVLQTRGALPAFALQAPQEARP